MIEPVRNSITPPVWGSLTDRLAHETASRPARLEQLSQKVDTLFSGAALTQLRADIKASFDTVQHGKYHHEGIFMDSHLSLILKSLDDARRGEISQAIPPSVREVLQATVRANYNEFVKYAFLHDLEKPGCMTVAFLGGSKRELQREEALSLVSPEGVKDCAKARREIEEKRIEKVSYFHSSTDRTHGRVAAERLAAMQEPLGVSESLLKAIELHEVAYLFDSPRAATFRRHFGALSADAQAWVMTASYIDLMGSLDSRGQPDLSPFLTLTLAMQNSEKISFLESERGEGGRLHSGVDTSKVGTHISQLLKGATPIEGTCEELLTRVVTLCKIRSYERCALTSALDTLVVSGLLEKGAADSRLLSAEGGATVVLHPDSLSNLRRSLAPDANKALSEALDRALEASSGGKS